MGGGVCVWEREREGEKEGERMLNIFFYVVFVKGVDFVCGY